MSTTPVVAVEPVATAQTEAAREPANPAWEFTPEQNVVLLHLAGRMRMVGVALILIAALLEAWAVLGTGGMLALQAGIVLALTGWWSTQAAVALVRAARTHGADRSLLMRALREISKLYELQYWIFLVTALVLAVTLLLTISGGGGIREAW